MAMHRLLVTGASGFVGRWILAHWRRAYPSVQIWATSDQASFADDRADRCSVEDLCDAGAVKNLVAACNPTHVIHLAGLVAEASLEKHLRVNVLGTENLYSALADLDEAGKVRIVQAGTAAMYGRPKPEELPIKEMNPFRPLTSYAISKMMQDYLAALFGRTRGLHIVRARIFNLLGPGQPGHLVPATFIRQLVALRRGQSLQVGNLATRRDFVDVRDVAWAFDRLLLDGRAGAAYNVASGVSVAIGDILRRLVEIAGAEGISVAEDVKRVRGNDVPDVYADISAIRKAVAWRPQISLRQSLSDMWNEDASKNLPVEQR